MMGPYDEIEYNNHIISINLMYVISVILYMMVSIPILIYIYNYSNNIISVMTFVIWWGSAILFERLISITWRYW